MASPGGAGGRSADRIARMCEAPADSRDLRLRLLEEIRGAVPFDAHAWLLTDPATSVGSSPLAAVPCLPELPDLIRLKYLTEVNRWTRLETPVALLSEATHGLLSRSRVWRELQARYNVVDVASVVFRDQFGCWAFLDLWRATALGRFTAAELQYLTAIAGSVTTALRLSQASTFITDSIQTDYPRGPVVLLLSGTLDVLAQTPETQEYLRVLVPPDENRSPIPVSAYNVAAQLLAVEAGIDANPPTARVHLFGGRWLTLRAARIADAPPSHQAAIAVTVEHSSPTERTQLFSAVHGLSSRERELLDHLVRGRDTRELARLMFLSPLTIQDHLKSVFLKTAVHNRRTLLSRARGT